MVQIIEETFTRVKTGTKASCPVATPRSTAAKVEADYCARGEARARPIELQPLGIVA